MKRNILRITVISLSILAGWVLGFLRLPHINVNRSFWIGFLFCFGIFLFLWVCRTMWFKNAALFRWMQSKQVSLNDKSAKRTYALLWSMVSVFIVVGGVAGALALQYQSNNFKKLSALQDRRIRDLSEMTESIRKSNQVFLMSNVLNKVDEELKNKGVLTDATIARIAALNHSFKPYRYFEGDSLSSVKLSPERGQLLISLILTNMDSSSFNKIKRSTSFEMADLRGADLRNAQLQYIDLKSADLQDADLTRANISQANLSNCNFSSAKLIQVDGHGSTFRYANLSWAELNEANLSGVMFNGAVIESTHFLHADLHESSFQYARLTNAMLNNTNLNNCNLNRSDLRRANLSNADLTGSDIAYAKINESTMSGANFTNVDVQPEWLDELAGWQVNGTEELRKLYKVACYTYEGTRCSNFRLEPQ